MELNEHLEQQKEFLENGLVEAMGIPVDTFGNPLTNTESLSTNISQVLLSLQPVLLNYAYKQYGFLQTAVDQPIDDAFRGGVGLESAKLDVEDMELLKQKMEDDGDWEAIKSALKWARLFGGSVLIANTDQDPSTILSETKLKNKRLKFYAADRWEAVCQDTSVSPNKSKFLYGGVVVDNSRLMPLFGKDAPYYVRLRLQGWGMSMFEQVLPPLVQYMKAQNVLLELLDEAKIDILKIFDLASTLMQPNGTELIKKRLDAFSSNKNFKTMGAMDSKDDYQQKQISFSGLPEMSKEIRLLISAALKMPQSKIFGIGSSGFSSGEDDLENYNSLVESQVRVQALRLIKWVVDLRCMQLFGIKLPDLSIKWSSLRVMSALEEADIRTKNTDNGIKILNAQILTRRQLASKLVKEGVLDLTPEEIERIPDEYLETPEIKMDEFV